MADPVVTSPDLIEVLSRLATVLEAGAVEGLDPGAAAAFVGVSVSKWHDLNHRGLCPSAATVGDSDRLPRWSRTELRHWIQAGAPARLRWKSMRADVMRRAG